MKSTITITRSAQSLTEEEIGGAEQKLGRKIPDPYREFLLKFNGGRAEPSDFVMALPGGATEIGTVKRFLGIDTPEETFGLAYVLETFKGRMPARLFPVACDPGGNLICISTGGVDEGQVFFWDHDRESEEGEPPTEANIYLIAAHFRAFLEGLHEA
ncbi:MAG: SMI1/KNR4 family protein [Gemmatimonadaceae bacterium]